MARRRKKAKRGHYSGNSQPRRDDHRPRRKQSLYQRLKRRYYVFTTPIWILVSLFGWYHGQQTGDWRIFVIGAFGVPYADFIITF